MKLPIHNHLRLISNFWCVVAGTPPLKANYYITQQLVQSIWLYSNMQVLPHSQAFCHFQYKSRILSIL